MTAPRDTRYDAVIVGSGPTGGYAAKALTEAGMRVAVLDAGPSARQSNLTLKYDELQRKWGYRIEEDPAAVRRQKVQSSCYAWVTHPHAFVNDEENPYSTDGGPFLWIRCRRVGGRMGVRRHALQFYRFSEQDFEAGDRDGASAAWPLSYADLVPYYRRIERWMRIRGTADQLAQLPDSELAGDVPYTPAERLLKTTIERRWKDWRLIPGRTAPPPMPIADALATGRCTLRADAVVTRVTVDVDSARADGVVFVDRVTRRQRELKARIVVLCASSIETARLLLASATRQHPDGLANSSGAVGRYLMDHTVLERVSGQMPLADADLRPEPSWSYVPRFRNVTEADGRFVRGYGAQIFTWGRLCGITVFGEMLPYADNRVTLDPGKTDRWGVPVARISCTHRDNERAMACDEVEVCREILDAAKMDAPYVKTDLSRPGLAIHEVGTARMGDDPTTSVLNSFCQSWDVKNLFVMDGSCFVTQAVQNPTLTMLALAARSCDYLIDSRKRGEL